MSSKRLVVVMMAFLVALTAALALADGTKPAVKAKPGDAAQKAKPAAKTTPKPAEVKSDAAKSEAVPRLTIVEPVKDYGTVAKGEKLDWAFLVKNTGTADLQIISAKPGCGCTVADYDKVIKPGETGRVTAHVDTTAFAGPIAKSVTLETNDPSTPTSQLTIHAVVKPYVEAYPAGFVRYNMLQGDAETESVTLYSEEDDPFEITKIEAPEGNWVKVTSTKIASEAEKAPNVGKPGQAQYKLAITVGGPDARVGPLYDKIKITTNSKHQPEYLISLSGVIRPTYRVEPVALNFGEVTATEAAATRSILLHSNDMKTPDSFVVTKAESSMPAVTAAVKPGANKGDYEVTLQLAKDAKPGDIDGTVKIYTTDKVNPIVSVPVKGTVKIATASTK
jgi:hypothetical protein